MIYLLVWFVGVLFGMIVMGVIVLKDHDESFERAYSLGKRYGMELIMMRKSTDKEMWELIHKEVTGDA
jgi:hypothetical protein